MPNPPVRKLLRIALWSALLLTTFTLATACDKDGNDGGAAAPPEPSTGSVAILLTDGPVDPDEFAHIYVTYVAIVLIGEPGQIEVFSGEETIDLREVEDISKLVTIGRGVPKGCYEKIRLEVTQIELVPANGAPSIFPKLPPKVDLNPRGGFCVKGGKMLLIQLDIDAEKSILIIETGNGGYRFRPVVFVDIISKPYPGKLVLLDGTVEEIDLANSTFLLCGSHSVSRPFGGDRESLSESSDETDDRDDFCVTIVVDPGEDGTCIFDEKGDPAELKDLGIGDSASVLGRFRRSGDDDHDEKLVFDAEVVQLGDDVTALDGVVASEPDADGLFLMKLDPGQGIVTEDGKLLVAVRDCTRIFRRRGDPLGIGDIDLGDPVRAVGVLSLSSSTDVLKAAVVVLDIGKLGREQIDGIITETLDEGARLTVATEAGSVCVDVESSDDVLLITMDEDMTIGKPIDRSELMVGDRVSVFGKPNGCFDASTVIVFDDPEAEPLSLGGGSGGFTAGALGVSGAAVDEDEEEPDAEGSAEVEVYEFGPRRTEAGLIWAKLPGDGSGAGAEAGGER